MRTINKLISSYNFNAGNTSRIKYIVIHYVGALGGAKANCQYYAGGNRNASAHYFVGFDGEIWQSVEDKNIAWHCGASSYKHGECRNANSIGIELCVRKKNTASLGATDKDWYFEDATVEAAAELTRYLMDKYNVPASKVIRHYDVTGKICPNPYVYNTTAHTWDEFKNMISGNAGASQQQLYRVRKSWEDAKSQIGAFSSLDNAKKACTDGYSVYDWNGKAVYSAGGASQQQLYRVRKSWEDAKSQIGAFSSLDNAKKACTDGYSVYDWNGKAVYSAGGAGSTGTAEPGADATERTIWDFLKSKGFNDFAVAGVMGNLFAESGLNPQNLQNTYNKKFGKTDAQYTTEVDNGSYTNFVHDSAGYGLAQWTYYSRKQGLLDAARDAGVSIGNMNMQLAYLWQELQGYKSVMATLKAATSVRAASDAVLTGFEKPADQSEAVQKKRAEYGQAYYDKYAGTQTAAPQETPQAAAGVPFNVRVEINDLRIRTGAGTNYAKTGKYTGAGVFTITEVKAGKGSTAGWGKLKSGAGWISLDYCTRLA